MQSAGFTETRSHPPIQKLAKASKLRCQAGRPHFVYSLLYAGRSIIHHKIKMYSINLFWK